MKTMIYILILTAANFSLVAAQTGQSNSYQPADPMQNISPEITKISKSVQTLNGTLKDLLEKFAVGKGMQLTERQQKLLLGFEILNRAELRLEILQKFQIELTQKDGEVKTRLAQVEENLLPGSVERNMAFIGTTKGDELRETRKKSVGNRTPQPAHSFKSNQPQFAANLRRIAPSRNLWADSAPQNSAVNRGGNIGFVDWRVNLHNSIFSLN